MEEGVEEIPLGLYLVKGDMMCVLCPLFHHFDGSHITQNHHRRAGRND